MRTSSFDIFDTCVVRKCGAPKNLFDVLSYRVFSDDISAEQRLEFIACRQAADETTTFNHLYDTFNYMHPLLLSKAEIMQKELECEREMMVPVETILQKVNDCREKGDFIVFVSDMYLPADFLKKALSELGFYREGDGFYVSGDCGCKKEDGTLFQLIKKTEKLDYRDWHHYGDNLNSDILIPNNLGITTNHVRHEYLPYQRMWIGESNDITFHTGGIMAGIGRSIMLSTEENPHKAFAVDISAPLTVAFAIRLMTDAEKRGIKRLYFCSRDSYALYHVSERLEKVFTSIECMYFHTSREALYDTKEDVLIEYLAHIGLASVDENVGVVDIRSTGKSLKYLNDVLRRYGYQPVFGYYLEMYCSNYITEGVPPYYCEVNRLYCDLFTKHYPILETFLSLSPENKTVRYTKDNYLLSETHKDEDYYVDNMEDLSKANLSILCKYADYSMETELYRHSAEMMDFFVIPTIKHFFTYPHRDYLHSLRYFHVLREDGSSLPYVEETVTGLPLKIAFAAKTCKVRFIRRFLKLIMRMGSIKPLSEEEWWPEGTKAYNSL